MGIEAYDQYIDGTITVSAISANGLLQFTVTGGGSARAASIVRKTQSGSMRGAVYTNMNDNPNTNFKTGFTFLHSQRDITSGGTASFYGVVWEGSNTLRLRYFSNGISDVPGVLAQATGQVVSELYIAWDANASGLGATRITVLRGSATIMDVLDPFHPRTYSSGEGLFVAQGGGLNNATIECGPFSFLSFAGYVS